VSADRPALSTERQGNENLAAAVTEVSERVTLLIREEIELARVETIARLTSFARGLAAVGAGAVFGVFAVLLGMETLAWGIDAIFTNSAGDIWIGFLSVTVILLILTGASFLFAWRKLRGGAPAPKMAIDEAKKIRETVSSSTRT
jgi:hypothetical protein